MAMKGSGRARNWQEIDRWDGGVGWIAYPDEVMRRASHALAVDGEVWVVDPVDAPGLDELLAEFGEVAGVVVLLDRHTRDAGAIARRHGVSVHVPHWMTGVQGDIGAPVERVRTELGSTGYGVHKVVDNPVWQEAALYGEDTGALVVPESVGTADFFLTGDERLGVHPALRLFPPKRLGRLSPDRILVGHGAGIDKGAAEALDDALEHARSRAPSLYAETVREYLLS